jgi:hypothetical protein
MFFGEAANMSMSGFSGFLFEAILIRVEKLQKKLPKHTRENRRFKPWCLAA